MARTSKTNKRRQLQQEKMAAAPTKRAKTSRRDILGWVGLGIVGAGAVTAGGAWAVSSFNQSVAERDLDRIGQGKPAIVQIHDPQCPICNALQRETRKALAQMEGEPPVYLVADLTQTEGAVFAQLHRVPHVTLLVFDGEGNRVETISGSRTHDELLPVFNRHNH